jgi:hypothetical protein
LTPSPPQILNFAPFLKKTRIAASQRNQREAKLSKKGSQWGLLIQKIEKIIVISIMEAQNVTTTAEATRTKK